MTIRSWLLLQKIIIYISHYSDVIMGAMAFRITGVSMFAERQRSKKTSKLRVTGFCEGNPQVTGGSPHTGPVMRKIYPFHDVIMGKVITTIASPQCLCVQCHNANTALYHKNTAYWVDQFAHIKCKWKGFVGQAYPSIANSTKISI